MLGSIIMGKLTTFCSKSCKDMFEKSPTSYTRKKGLQFTLRSTQKSKKGTKDIKIH